MQDKHNSHTHSSFLVRFSSLIQSGYDSPMSSKADEYTRRILSFPAIRPCESVTFSTLFPSLISLGHAICEFKSTTIYTNKKNARVSIHLIETLIVFLQEIGQGDPMSDASKVLSLSELHFILQKVRFLLEDCTRDDARLWMLVKSEDVSTQFRVLMRAIALALDVLPLSGLNVDVEVKELMEFVKRQALKPKFEVEVDDSQARRRVFLMLDQLKDGIAPKSSDLKRVLEHLEIKSWNECHRVFKFLETQAVEECLSADSRDLRNFIALKAFMIYCRCTLFTTVDNVKNPSPQSSDGGLSREMIGCLNPDDFRCPISLDIMTDPVTISTGHTYDRSSILKWLKSGNHTCPKTGERLHYLSLLPNQAMKSLIKQYCHEKMIPFSESGVRKLESPSLIAEADSLVAGQAIKLVASYLVSRLVDGTIEEQIKSAYEIRLLSKTSIFNRSCLVEVDVIPPLMDMVCSSSSSGQENAMAALLNLSKYSKTKTTIVENRGLERVVKALNEGLTMGARQHAAGALFYLASVEKNRRMIGRMPAAISGLIELLRTGTDRGKKNALVTILVLLMYPDNHWRVLAAGLVLLLVDILKSSEREDLVADSLAVLAVLGEKLEGATAIFSTGALPVILDILVSSDSRTTREYIVSLLLALCINDGADVVPILVKSPSLMVSLYSLLADGSPRSSKKASSIIRILHAYNEKVSVVSALPQEHFVHVW